MEGEERQINRKKERGSGGGGEREEGRAKTCGHERRESYLQRRRRRRKFGGFSLDVKTSERTSESVRRLGEAERSSFFILVSPEKDSETTRWFALTVKPRENESVFFLSKHIYCK